MDLNKANGVRSMSVFWLQYYMTVMQDVTIGGTWVKDICISLYYFLELHVNIKSSQNKKKYKK